MTGWYKLRRHGIGLVFAVTSQNLLMCTIPRGLYPIVKVSMIVCCTVRSNAVVLTDTSLSL
jgi:hypothetical protein